MRKRLEKQRKNIFLFKLFITKTWLEKDRNLLMHTVKNHGTFNKYTMYI